MPPLRWVVVLAASSLLGGCPAAPDPGVDGGADSGVAAGTDPGADTGDVPDPLADWDCTPDDTVTWGGFADGFFSAYCRSCHSTTTPDRRGAPEGVDFTDRAEVLAWAPRIKARVLDADTMPPGGGTVFEDRSRFEGWLCAQTRVR